MVALPTPITLTGLPPLIPNRLAVLRFITLTWEPESKRKRIGGVTPVTVASIQMKPSRSSSTLYTRFPLILWSLLPLYNMVRWLRTPLY